MLAPLEDGVMALAMAEAAKRFFDEGVTVNLANIYDSKLETGKCEKAH